MLAIVQYIKLLENKGYYGDIYILKWNKLYRFHKLIKIITK